MISVAHFISLSESMFQMPSILSQSLKIQAHSKHIHKNGEEMITCKGEWGSVIRIALLQKTKLTLVTWNCQSGLLNSTLTHSNSLTKNAIQIFDLNFLNVSLKLGKFSGKQGADYTMEY